jgi:hypothetical protein
LADRKLERIALMTARGMYRHLMAMTYFTSTVAAFAGALNLWLAIHFWLTDAPFMSALFTCVSFWNGKLFLDDMEQRRRLRAIWEGAGDRS